MALSILQALLVHLEPDLRLQRGNCAHGEGKTALVLGVRGFGVVTDYFVCDLAVSLHRMRKKSLV